MTQAMATETRDMANERPNQFKIMLSDEEKAWLEELAARRGLTSSDVLRLYIREAHAVLRPWKRVGPLLEEEVGLLRKIHESDVIVAECRANGGDPYGLDPTTVDGWLGEQYDRDDHLWLKRTLNNLRHAGYTRRLRRLGYELTELGRSAIARAGQSEK
jgi:hypothetical protein